MAGDRNRDEDHGRGGHLAEAAASLAEGRWEHAHTLVQKDESSLASWVHGIVHIMEGDLDNARHWYGRADRTFPGADAVLAHAGRHAAVSARCCSCARRGRMVPAWTAFPFGQRSHA